MKQRPLSPHLQIYKPQITSVLSILHRLTGIMLSYVLIGFIIWLGFLCMSEHAYLIIQGFFSTIFGRLLLFGSTFCFFYHLFNGIRHLFWDIGCGFDLSTVTKSGMMVVLFSVMATIAYFGFF